MRGAAGVLVRDVACVRKKDNAVVVCGLHNRAFAECLVSKLRVAGAIPSFWVFDEGMYLGKSVRVVEAGLAADLEKWRGVLGGADVVVWLSQFDDLERFSGRARKCFCGFWDGVYERLRARRRLMVNLPSAGFVGSLGVDYGGFVRCFLDGVRVDYERLRRVGCAVAGRLKGKERVHVSDVNGTDLDFTIKGRRVGVEARGKGEREVDVPSGEVYVAPVESSAEGVLVVDELGEYSVRELRLQFRKGRIAGLEARSGEAEFRRMLERGEGGVDVLEEFGVGVNCGMRCVGWDVFDEKVLGTVHVAIGNNVHLEGTNKASIHVDFVLHKPTVKADDSVVMQKGKLARLKLAL
jgi:hypothetical protein